MIEITKSSYNLVCVFVPYLNMNFIAYENDYKTIDMYYITVYV